MVRLLSVAIDCFSAIVFLIPAVIILQYVLSKQIHIRKGIIDFIFAYYVMAVFSVTGVPAVQTLQINLNLNPVPLIDIVNSPLEYIKNTILNVILFMPMGFLLPVIWHEYRSAKKTVLTGFAVSFFIEVSQIFTFRLTDIDDLITNTLGTFSGYCISRLFLFRRFYKMSVNEKTISVKYEAVIIIVIVFLIAFFLKPLVSSAVWELVLSSPLWERIK